MLTAIFSHRIDQLGLTVDLAVLRFAEHLGSALGGTGFAVFSGLLIAGISVTGLLGRLLPAPVAITGLVLAVACEVAVLTTVISDLDLLLPIARFGGIIWLTTAAFTLWSRPTP